MSQRTPAPPITIRDVARAANVSVSTVSHVLSGNRPTSAATQQRVHQEVQRLGYRPNAVAQSLVWRKPLSLGLVIPDITNPYFPEFARGVEDRVRVQGYLLMLGNSAYDAEREHSYLELLRARQLAGVIFCLADERSPVRAELLSAAAQGLPVVMVHRPLPGVTTISADNAAGGRHAAQHLLGLGHRRIGVVGSRHVDEGMRDRERGFLEALQEAGQPTAGLPRADDDSQIEGGRRAAVRLLERWPDITAVFALNDLLALGVIDAARVSGRQVPGDLSVIGFDDIPFSALTNPPLTTIAQPIRQLGEQAADLLLALIREPRTMSLESPPQVQLESRLVVRGSTAPVHA